MHFNILPLFDDFLSVSHTTLFDIGDDKSPGQMVFHQNSLNRHGILWGLNFV